MYTILNIVTYLECASSLALCVGGACCADGMRAKQASRYESGNKLPQLQMCSKYVSVFMN